MLDRVMTETTETLPRGAISKRASGPRGLTTLQLVTFLTAVLAMVALRCWVAARFGFETDEPYYWLWSRGLALGYFDHPPMIAYFIRLGTTLFGNTPFGIRSMAIVSMIAASVLLYVLARTLFDDRRIGLLATLWFSVTPHTAFFSVIMFPDTPAILFWVLTCACLAKVWRTSSGYWWYLAGLSTGLLLLSKYTGVFLIGGIAAWLLASNEMRPWLRRYETYLGGLITLILFSPVIYWNAQHGWVSFIKQFGRALDTSSDGGLANMATFLGIQAAFVSPVIFIFIIAGLAAAAWRGLERQEANWQLLALTSAPILLYFLIHAFSAEVLPQWPSAAYAGGIVAAVAAFMLPDADISGRRAIRYSFVAAPWIALAFTLTLFAQMTVRPVLLPAKDDPLSRFFGWAELSSKARDAAIALNASYIVTDEQGLEGALAFYVRDLPVFQMSESIRYESLPPVDQALLKRSAGIYLASPGFDVLDRLRQHYDSTELASTIWRTRDGEPIEAFRIYRLKGYRGGMPF